ncbi:alpha/beta fold hydrolase [Parvularcula lutaonensis]|uniref:alpha/beta fold hydrolase n=1 Tax=Parvularcula lutaonensis TaxID=491923 RepID=UPI0016741E27|nr:alpha/beta hydrolase [Parvularcula lutaonensis]
MLFILRVRKSEAVQEAFHGDAEKLAIEGDRSVVVARYGVPDAGRVLLFDPGSFGIYADFHHIAQHLAREDWYVIAMTRAGMYQSDPLPEGQDPVPRFHVADMARVLDTLGIDRKVILAGHSMAGVRLHMAGRIMPERFRGLALLDAVCPSQMRGLAWAGWVAWAQLIGRAGARFARSRMGGLMESVHPNLLKLEGQPRNDKLASVMSEKHLRCAAREVAVTERKALGEPVEPAIKLPAFFATATQVSQGTSELLREYEKEGTWTRRIHLKNDGHMSMLTPPSSHLIAEGIDELWEAGAR